jgi:hypothetical protein
MKYGKTLSLLAAAAALMAVGASTASASSLTSPAGTTYTGTVSAESSHSTFHGSFVSVTCTSSTMSGKVEGHGAALTATWRLFSLTFGSCNYPITVNLTGSLAIHCCWPPRVTWELGARITIHTSIGECVFESNNTEVGTFTSGTPAVIDISSAAIPRTGGSFFCGSTGTWTGSYTVTTPGTLIVD